MAEISISFATAPSYLGSISRNLRQYVSAANRESTMFEQVLIGMLGMDDSDEDRAAKLERAFNKLHDLTDGVRTALLKNRVFESLNAIVEDADVDSIDDELSKAQKATFSRLIPLVELNRPPMLSVNNRCNTV